MYRRARSLPELLLKLRALAAIVVGVSATLPGKASNGGSATRVSALVLGWLECTWQGRRVGLELSSDDESILRFILVHGRAGVAT